MARVPGTIFMFSAGTVPVSDLSTEWHCPNRLDSPCLYSNVGILWLFLNLFSVLNK